MMTAPALLAQSASMLRIYADAYGLDEGRMLLAPPPMELILADIRSPAAIGLGTSSGQKLRGTLSTSLTTLGGDTSSQFRLLIYGRVARMKGAETIAAAAATIQAGLPKGISLHLSFVGLDWECPVHEKLTSLCVREILPHEISVSFDPPVERTALHKLASTMHGAIVASEFETYGLAAHELAATGLPLIIADIPAFSEFFTESNAYVFYAGNSASLALAAIALARDIILGKERVANIQYSDAIEPYLRVQDAMQIDRLNRSPSTSTLSASRGLASPQVDMRIIESAIANMEGPCWPTIQCRELGQRVHRK